MKKNDCPDKQGNGGAKKNLKFVGVNGGYVGFFMCISDCFGIFICMHQYSLWMIMLFIKPPAISVEVKKKIV